MNRDMDSIVERAIAWHLASDSDDMDWAGFTDWLEADPRHREAYDQVALGDAAVAAHAPVLATALGPDSGSANDNVMPLRPARRWLPWTGAAIAASLVALVAIPQLREPAPQLFETGAEPQLVALEDGSRIELAPHSSLSVGGSEQERIALDGGAWFDIRHDPSRPMVIRAGDLAISDIGTVFDVQATGDQVRVEVSEGEVSVASQALAQPVRLAAGRGLRYDAAAGRAVSAPVDKGEVGEWRVGRLTYAAAPLRLVTADLSRYAGVEIELGRGLADRQFSGTLAIGDGEAALQDLAQLMGLVLERTGAGYRLDAAG